MPKDKAYDTINRVAKEFIVSESKEDIFVLERMFVQKLNEVNLKNQRLILSFLDWLIDFCKSVSNLDSNRKLKICKKKSFGNVIKNIDLLCNREIRNIENLYREIVNRANKVCKDAEREKYISAYLHYTKILKNSFELIALLSFESAQRLSEEAKTDPLTGLLNRRYMVLILKDVIELSSITEQPFSIALIDIDNFKRINDTYGHLVGDCVLRKLAELLKNNFRKGDYIFRYGGEEFLVVMPSTGLKEALAAVERLRRVVEKHTFVCGCKEIRTTISIGLCSEVPKNPKNVYEYIMCADKKLYEAKKLGRNRVVF